MENYKDEVISAFAFKVGKELEKLVEERADNLANRLQSLEAKVLKYHQQIKQSGNTNLLKDYEIYFNITSDYGNKN